MSGRESTDCTPIWRWYQEDKTERNKKWSTIFLTTVSRTFGIGTAYDIYFKFDHAAKTVTFALGGEKKVVPLEEYTGWSWKLTGTKLLCGTSFELEKTFLDEFWAVVPVNLGRKVLRIKDVI